MSSPCFSCMLLHNPFLQMHFSHKELAPRGKESGDESTPILKTEKPRPRDSHVLFQALLWQGLQRLFLHSLALHLKTLLPIPLPDGAWSSSHKLPPAFQSRI